MSCDAFDCFHHIGSRPTRLDAYEPVDMIRLDREFNDLPSLRGALLLNQPPTGYGKRILQHGLAALRRPDKAVANELHPMFITLVVHRLTVRLLIAVLTA